MLRTIKKENKALQDERNVIIQNLIQQNSQLVHRNDEMMKQVKTNMTTSKNILNKMTTNHTGSMGMRDEMRTIQNKASSTLFNFRKEIQQHMIDTTKEIDQRINDTCDKVQEQAQHTMKD